MKALFYIGGNDSAETANIIAQEAEAQGYDLRCFHIPKTIDNDLLCNDHTPGYGSAARFVACAVRGDDLDNRALGGVKIDVIMGRNAGFFTAAAPPARFNSMTAHSGGWGPVTFPPLFFQKDYSIRSCDTDTIQKDYLGKLAYHRRVTTASNYFKCNL